MAHWSASHLSEARGAFRLDAEFWRPEFLEAERRVLAGPHAELGTLTSSARKGIFHILAEEYVSTGVPFYRSANVGYILPREDDLVFINEERHQLEWKTRLTAGDLMIAKTARVAASAVFDECNISQDVIGLKLGPHSPSAEFIAAYLSSELGQLQIKRWFQGQVQGHLSLPDIRRVIVPLLPLETVASVDQLVRAARGARLLAQDRMAEAERLLVRALGLIEADDEEVGPGSVYHLSATRSAGRLDAEFFDNKLQMRIERLQRDGTSIGDLAMVAQRRWNRSSAGAIRYIEISSLGGEGVANPEVIAAEDAPSRATWLVSSGDVVTSTVRPIRRLSAVITGDEDASVCSSGFVVLRPMRIHAETLLVFLRLRQVCEILDLYTTASMYPALRASDVLSLPIPIISEDESLAVAALAQEAIRSSRMASSHLRAAVALIESSIEQR